MSKVLNFIQFYQSSRTGTYIKTHFRRIEKIDKYFFNNHFIIVCNMLCIQSYSKLCKVLLLLFQLLSYIINVCL